MKDLKIHVANEAESKEAQELFFKLGFVWTDTKCQTPMKYTNPVIYSSFNDGDLCCDKYDVSHNHKEITLAELRNMANQDQDEPFLTPETTLNDQYAGIEQVRQNAFKPTDFGVSMLPEFKHDFVNHPKHYCDHPSGIECIEITRHHDFAIGNAIKYLWRAGLKDSDNEIQDLKKAVWYIQDKIAQLENK